ncbi:FAD-binding oxidoreductase [Tardiphaga sp. vice352]|uniref:NAD(P)/FAD-dependent oxidoreductase n=1 Tax=unclassified Tardiphaga TaxID=2631404 RepID=UPI0011632425|nr:MULTISPECIES: FAD-binding oxidoreductase [unclassified Tardiphaga]QDM19058.1 FAD-binding oxidoreductase [Tardiphaga sp. vice278]QDM24040.1 FAD-binding oxidoreductase [Tardiphaga sp. vice154]QDM29261.1 FAD-binding oxidoreductase [Tardiphaga sp. vice304]QDM34360.1 FAD-binding oxidoreductase [Tardiphaga sp. vice352]
MTSQAPYDPHYDPLVSASPGRNRRYAPTYWVDTAGTPPEDDGPVSGDIDADVAIIGSGYTGLACAIFLAREFGIKAVVLEANGVAWGCSTRNGGQGQNAAGRLSRSQWIERWGRDIALKLHAEVQDGFETFEELIASGNIDCEPQRGGHLHIAHRQRALDHLAAESRVQNEVFGYKTHMLSAEDVRRDYLNEAEAVGALHEPLGTGVHAARLAFGYQRMARELGAKVHPGSPVLEIMTNGGIHSLRTPGGTVRARAVGIATGAYTAGGLTPALRGRCMPILSNSIVTRPLTPAELDVTGFRTTQVITDTRTLRYYYRLLPDNRVQIGSRSAITGADAAHPRHLQLLIDGLHRKFPALTGIEIDYSWWGWVDVSHDMMPRIFRPDPKQTLFYALGYGGNGVSYSAQAGRRMAQMIGGQRFAAQDLPIFTSPLPPHPFTSFRRIGQRMLYRLYQMRDEAA